MPGNQLTLNPLGAREFTPDVPPEAVFTAEAVLDFEPLTPNNDGLEVPALSFSKGDIISIVDRSRSGWWQGVHRGKSGWFPSSLVRLIPAESSSVDPLDSIKPPTPQLQYQNPSQPSAHTHYLASEIASSRKNSQFSNHSVGSSEPTDFELDEDLSTYTTIEVGDYTTNWIAHSQNGVPVYVDTICRVIAHTLSKTVLNDLASRHTSPEHHQLGEGDYFGTQRRATDPPQCIRMECIWAELTHDLNIPIYESWKQAKSLVLQTVQAMADGKGGVPEIIAHVQGISLAAGVPAGTFPSLSYGDLSAQYRLMINYTILAYMETAHGQPVDAILESLSFHISRFIDLYLITREQLAEERGVALDQDKDLISPYCQYFNVYSFQTKWEQVMVDSKGDICEDIVSPAPQNAPRLSMDSNDTSSVVSEAQSQVTLGDDKNCKIMKKMFKNFSINPKSSSSSQLVNQIDAPGWVQLLDLESYLPKCVVQDDILQTILANRQFLTEAIDRCVALYQLHHPVDESGRCMNRCNASLLKTQEDVDKPTTIFFAGLNSVITVFSSLVGLVDSLDIRPFHTKACESITPDPFILEKLCLFLSARGKIYEGLSFIGGHVTSVPAPHNSTHSYGDIVQILPGLALSVDEMIEVMTTLRNYYDGNIGPVARTSQVKSDVAYARDGSLRGGTKRGLIEQTTLHDQRKPEVISAFLTTFPAFMNGIELLDLLIERFNSRPPANLISKDDIENWRKKVLFPIRLRVVNVLKQWLDIYWRGDIIETKENQETFWYILTEFIQNLVDEQFPGASALGEILRVRRSGTHEPRLRRKSRAFGKVPTPIYTAAHDGELGIEYINPTELARQMTIVKWDYYIKISKNDLLGRFVKSVKTGGNSVSNYVNYWNQESSWVSAKVLEMKEAKYRAERLSYFIEVAEACLELNNFSTMMAIISALYSAGIYRLKNTWSLIPEVRVKRLEKLQEIMASRRNFTTYRERLSLVNDSAIPFFGLCLMDLQFTHDGNPDFIGDEEEMVNFGKWMTVGNIIDETLRFQEMTYRLLPQNDILDMLDSEILESTPMNEQYNISLELEPRQSRAHASTHGVTN